MDTILVVNAGSSSVKFQVFAVSSEQALRRRLKGQIDGIGTKPKMRVVDAAGAVLIEQTYPVEQVPDVPAALNASAAWLRDQLQVKPIAVGHRVVHGGPDFDQPLLVDDAIVDRLERFVPLAPLHQPFNLSPIRTLRKNAPDIPQVACFDTAFHRGHDEIADHYAIPRELYDEGVRRYGFHGLSYEYISQALQQLAPETAKGRVIVAHLGSGASMCALQDGRSVESTMGFTALDGLPMGTRPGQIDPGVILYLLTEKGMSPSEVQNLLYRECGLKGLSGASNDIRDLLAATDDPRAAFAIDYFVHRIALNAAMLAAALEGIDAFVFTAGIGENSAQIRSRIVARLSWLGARLDREANARNSQLISAPQSSFAVYVLPTDEELMIAKHTLSLLRKRAQGQPQGRLAS
jgi:acetate kinase